MTPDPNAPVAQKSWFGRNWKWLLPVGCVVPMLCCLSFAGATYFGVSKVITASGPFTDAITRANGNADVQATLGTPLTPGLGVSGSLNETNGSGSANFTVPLEGPKGKGTLRVEGRGRGGQWTYSVMEIEAGGKIINLLEGGGGRAPNDLPPPDDQPEPEPEDPPEVG